MSFLLPDYSSPPEAQVTTHSSGHPQRGSERAGHTRSSPNVDLKHTLRSREHDSCTYWKELYYLSLPFQKAAFDRTVVALQELLIFITDIEHLSLHSRTYLFT